MCGMMYAEGMSTQVYAHAKEAMKQAAARGPHTHGWFYLHENKLPVFRFGQGPLADPFEPVNSGRGRRYAPPVPPLLAQGHSILGHSRLATDSYEAGGVPDPSEGQPLTCDENGDRAFQKAGRYVLAHNGTAPGLTGEYAPRDSRALVRLATLEGLSALTDLSLYSGRPQAIILYDTQECAAYAVRMDGTRRPAHPLYLTRPKGGLVVSMGPLNADSTLLPTGLTPLER